MTFATKAIAVFLVCLSAFVATATPASATVSCTFADSGTVAFGTISTSTNQTYNVTDQFNINCTGGSANEALTACLLNYGSPSGGSSLSGPYYMMNGSNKLTYNLYTNSARTIVLKIGSFVVTTFTLSSSGAGSANVTVYYQVASGQTALPAGSYATTQSILLLLGDQASLPPSNCEGTVIQSTNLTEPVTATNQGQCTVSGGTLSFGSVGLLTSNVDQSGTITPSCSAGISYTISLDGGQHGGTSATNRRMVNGAGSVTYGLYSDSGRTSGWYGASVSAVGTGSAQPVTVYGRVPAQTTPSPATYTDTVVITVTF